MTVSLSNVGATPIPVKAAVAYTRGLRFPRSANCFLDFPDASRHIRAQ